MRKDDTPCESMEDDDFGDSLEDFAAEDVVVEDWSQSISLFDLKFIGSVLTH